MVGVITLADVGVAAVLYLNRLNVISKFRINTLGMKTLNSNNKIKYTGSVRDTLQSTIHVDYGYSIKVISPSNFSIKRTKTIKERIYFLKQIIYIED